MVIVVVAVFLVVARCRRRRRPGRGRARALVLVTAILGFSLAFGAPATAQDDCVRAPIPEKPDDGLVGFLDPPGGKGEEHSEYREHAYAGMVWHFHEDTCSGVTRWTEPGASLDTWAGNGLFDIAKNIVGANNSLHYVQFDDWPFRDLLDGLKRLADRVFDNIYLRLFGLCLLIVAVLLFRRIWRGDLASVGRSGLFVLGGIWFASSSVVMLNLAPAFASTYVTVTNAVRVGFVEPEDVDRNRHRMPTELYEEVIHENWLRGEFGSPDAPQAKEYGDELLDAKAWTWDEVLRKQHLDEQAVNAKQEAYQQLATKLGTATRYFRGTAGIRVGSGFLALSKGLMFAVFPLGANLAIVMLIGASVFIALTAPVIGLVGMVRPDILRRIVMGFLAQVRNVLVLVMLSGIHQRFLQLIFSDEAELSLLTQMLLGGAVTIIFTAAGRPARSMISIWPKGNTKNQDDSPSSATGDIGEYVPEDSAPPLGTRPEAAIPTTEIIQQPDDDENYQPPPRKKPRHRRGRRKWFRRQW
jgi:hypothetical protein